MNNIGLKVNGSFFKNDGGVLTWDEFIDMMDSSGINYMGQTVWIDEEGNIVHGIFGEE